MRASTSQNIAVPPPSAFDAESSEHSKKVRRLLFIAFGWLLVLLIGAGTDALFSVRRLDRASQEVSQRFTAHNRALGTIVVSVRVYDDQLERFLLQDQLQESAPVPADITTKIAAVRAALVNFPQDRDPEEQFLLAAMLQQLQEQETSCAVVLAWRSDLRQQRAYQFIGQQLIPWRTRIFELTAQVSSFDEHKLALENLAVAERFQALESRLVW
ncbi:MAG TPA: hypothetical protein VMR90_16885, partial [Candidatus Cybelea sp.]|nr:hypothetical protein [Candidatus Cybelea sp.]